MFNRLSVFTSVAVVALSLAACSPKTEEAAAPAAPAEPAAPVAPAIAAFTETPDSKPFKIGAYEAAALSDGGGAVPNDNKTLATNKKKADVDAVLKAANLPTDMIELSIQPLIVNTGDHVLLFDTGTGGAMWPETTGKFAASFAAAGGAADKVTDIFISHAHGDHVGGLVKDGTLAFPNAAIHMSANEWASLKSQKPMEALVTVITPKVVEFQPDAEIIPGQVKAVDIKGHTPGHSGYLITSGADSILYQGDVMHHSIISVQQPDWTIAFDGDAKVAQASRKAELEAWAASGQKIYAVHFPFPGIGKYEKQGDKFVWVAG
ncbi:MAG TPA: MBL fold metallo-hydrolase [Hyphomonadaceae bacterium]|nr:MBL fold metallo-hydrolase [Hyphomonadaceae bacterium]